MEEVPDTGNGEGVSLFEEALLVSEAQEPSREQCTKHAAAIRKQSSAAMASTVRKKSGYPGITGLPGGSEGKVPACNVGDLGSIPGLGRSPGEGNGNPLQYSSLENPMDGGAWWATSLSLSCIGEGNGNPLQYSSLENPRDRGAWWAAIYEVARVGHD